MADRRVRGPIAGEHHDRRTVLIVDVAGVPRDEDRRPDLVRVQHPDALRVRACHYFGEIHSQNLNDFPMFENI